MYEPKLQRRRFMRGSPSPVNGAGPFQANYERVRSLERARDENIVCFLYPCSLGIRGFESHPPHLCINYRFILRKDDITRTKELDILEIGIRTSALQFLDSKHSIG